MRTQIVVQFEPFSEPELESLQFQPEELDSIEQELYPNLESISFQDVAQELEAVFERDEAEGLEGKKGKGSHSHGSKKKGKGKHTGSSGSKNKDKDTGNGSSPSTKDQNVPAGKGLTPDQKRRAEQLTSLFENGTIKMQYGYAEKLNDGRGITAGRAGFTTATGDALQVVQLYKQKKSNNELAKFLPELEKLAKSNSSNTSHLQGFAEAWKKAAQDPVFRAAQDEVVDKEYYRPSAKHADRLGLQTALARVVLYDTIIQHGNGNDPDGLPALLKRTPKAGKDEKAWVQTFIKTRRATLAHAHNAATRKEWAKSVGRCDVFSQIAESGNYDLRGPIKINTKVYPNTTIP